MAVLLLSAAIMTAARADDIPNPVAIQHQFMGTEQTYSVDCWSSYGVHGTWVSVTDSTLTTQEALIYHPFPGPPSARPPTISVLYCYGSDGKPGTISGAPAGEVLPTGSRVVVNKTAMIMLSNVVNGKPRGMGLSVMLDDDTRIDSRASGIVVRALHSIMVYPAGSTLTVGGGEVVGYIRPGTVLRPKPAVSGCTVSYIDANNQPVKTVHYLKNCTEMPLAFTP